MQVDALLLERVDLGRLRALGRLDLAQPVAHLRELLLDRARAVGRRVARGDRRGEVRLRLPRDPPRVEDQALDQDRPVADEDPGRERGAVRHGHVHVRDRRQELHPFAHHAVEAAFGRRREHLAAADVERGLAVGP